MNFPTGAFDGALRALGSVREMVTALDRTWEVDFHFADGTRQPPRTLRGVSSARQATIVEVIGYQQRGYGTRPPRDPFEVRDADRDRLFDKVAPGYAQRAIDGDPQASARSVVQSIAFALRDLAVDRWEHGGGDLGWDALAPSTLARKLALGYPASAGRMTGQSLQALRRALPVARPR